MIYKLKLLSILIISTFFTIACATKSEKVEFDGTYAVQISVAKEKAKALLSGQKEALFDEFSSLHMQPIMVVTEPSEDKVELMQDVEYPVWFKFSPPRPDVELKGLLEKDVEAREISTLKDAWSQAYIEVERLDKLLSMKKISSSAIRAFEPNVALLNENLEKKIKQDDKEASKVKVNSGIEFKISKKASKVWGGGQPGWHMKDNYSQLESARSILKSKQTPNNKRVLIGHLDTGFYSKDALLLKNHKNDRQWPFGEFLEYKSKNFYKNKCKSDQNLSLSQLKRGECPGHGAETLSVLAGGAYSVKVDGKDYSGVMGGNPYANVLEYRIGKGVVHLRPVEMSDAILSAVNEGVDVISISAGGLPSSIQRDAVNLAYEKGTAIFAATGDFFKLPFGLSLLGIDKTPSLTAFPARYNRVMAVAGTTYDFESYGEDPYWSFWGLFKHPFSLSAWGSWMMRGNYGPHPVMDNAQAVSAYSPNIFKSESISVGNGQKDINVSLNGAGTSHSTPQVAAAASIWLQLQRDKIEKKNLWRSWQKAEAVYQAVSVCSADRTKRPKGMTEREFTNYFGAGHLKARNALNYHFPDNTDNLGLKRAQSRIGYTWLYDLIASMKKNEGIGLAAVYAAMMQVEALQFSFVDNGLSHMSEIVESCLYKAAIKEENINNCSDQVYELLNELESYPHISEKLRSTIKKIVAAKSKGNIEEGLNKEVSILERALQQANRNTCRLDRLDI